MKYQKILIALVVVASLAVPFFTHAQPAVQSGCYDSGGLGGRMGPLPPIGRECPPGQYPVREDGRSSTLVNPNLSYVPLEPLPGQDLRNANFCQLINLVFKVLIYLGGMVAVLFLVLGGITYMVSEVVDKKSAARQRIKAAVWGLLLLLCAYLILYTINPALVTACNVLNSSTTTAAVQAPQHQTSPATLREVCRSANGIIKTGTVGGISAQGVVANTASFVARAVANGIGMTVGVQIVSPWPTGQGVWVNKPITCADIPQPWFLPKIRCTTIQAGEICLWS